MTVLAVLQLPLLLLLLPLLPLLGHATASANATTAAPAALDPMTLASTHKLCVRNAKKIAKVGRSS